MSALDLAFAMATARRAVGAASVVLMQHFARGVTVELKRDHSPVTAADRDSEDAIVAVIREAFPDHAILGEETGEHRGAPLGAKSRWIVDPLDGTRGFTRAETFWGPLVGLEHDGAIVAGAMALPVTGETYFAARGKGAWIARGNGDPVCVHVSAIGRWADATLSLGEPKVLLAPPFQEPIARLATTCARTRCHGDLAGFAMVLAGRAEAWVEAGVQVWDLAPMKILIEEAGGRFTDLLGRPTILSGNCIVSNGLLHGHVLEMLSGLTG